jgi:hypothetical protein
MYTYAEGNTQKYLPRQRKYLETNSSFRKRAHPIRDIVPSLFEI